MHPGLIVILIMLATHRVTRLIVKDHVTEPVRTRLQVGAERRWATRHPTLARVTPQDRWGSPLAFWLSCPWCVGLWVAAAVTGATWPIARFPVPVLVALAASTATGLIAELENALEEVAA